MLYLFLLHNAYIHDILSYITPMHICPAILGVVGCVSGEWGHESHMCSFNYMLLQMQIRCVWDGKKLTDTRRCVCLCLVGVWWAFGVEGKVFW